MSLNAKQFSTNCSTYCTLIISLARYDVDTVIFVLNRFENDLNKTRRCLAKTVVLFHLYASNSTARSIEIISIVLYDERSSSVLRIYAHHNARGDRSERRVYFRPPNVGWVNNIFRILKRVLWPNYGPKTIVECVYPIGNRMTFDVCVCVCACVW